jgi:hypothetical protein
MRTAPFTALALILAGAASPMVLAQQNRVVLHEMFTATWCVYCPGVRAAQSQIFALYPAQYIPVQVHQSDPWSYAWGNTRAGYYAVDGYPTTVQDGILRRIGASPSSTYMNDFNARKTIPTDVTLTIGGQQISGMQYQFTINVGLISSGTAKTVRLIVIQVLDDYPHDPQYPQYAGDERNCFIQSGTPTSEDIPLTPGQTVAKVRNFTFSGDSAAHLNNIRVVAWVQKTGTFPTNSEVYQAAYTTYPFFPDCNGNGTPDSEDMANCQPGDPDCADCNNNGTMDSCDIATCVDMSCQDCNGNGVPDGCEFTLFDCNNNGVSDECEISAGATPDCNGNGKPDSCDLADFTSPDCNTNNKPDECDLADCLGDAWCDDCNNNNKIDTCDLYADYLDESPSLTPLGYGTNHSYVLSNPANAVGDVLLTFTARGDLSSASEYVTVFINGAQLGLLWDTSGVDCAIITDTLTMSAAAFNAAKQSGGGDITILMVPSSSVAPAPPSCPNNTFIRVTTTYEGVATSTDANGNGIPDECEAPAGCPGDADCSGAVDFFDIDPFVALLGCPGVGDCNGACPWQNADADGDGDVDFFDIDPFVGLLGTTCP